MSEFTSWWHSYYYGHRQHYFSSVLVLRQGGLYDTILALRDMGFFDTLKCMPKKDAQKDVPSKIPRTVYLTAETSRRLDKAAAAEGVSNSIYIELTLKDRFKKDGIK